MVLYYVMWFVHGRAVWFLFHCYDLLYGTRTGTGNGEWHNGPWSMFPVVDPGGRGGHEPPPPQHQQSCKNKSQKWLPKAVAWISCFSGQPSPPSPPHTHPAAVRYISVKDHIFKLVIVPVPVPFPCSVNILLYYYIHPSEHKTSSKSIFRCFIIS